MSLNGFVVVHCSMTNSIRTVLLALSIAVSIVTLAMEIESSELADLEVHESKKVTWMTPEEINAVDEQGCTPLLVAAEKGYIKLAKALLVKGASVGAVDRNKRSSLFIACERGHTDLVELFLAKGAKRNAVNKRGETPVDFAKTFEKESDILMLFFTKEANICIEEYDGRSM